MAAASSSSSSSFSTIHKYDVFLSFRGEDTRGSFISHLHAALLRKQVETFIDFELKRGDEISSSLLRAIEESKISLVIFSKDYASSKWCLDELVKILECKKMNQQIVIPVFYHVKPSDVRKQLGSFEDSFLMHEQKYQEPKKTERWRAALTEASNLSGWDSSETRPESKLVEEIVRDILKKLTCRLPSSDFKGLIGMESRVKQVTSLLCIGKSIFHCVGIWGMGGIGKTTIAKAVLDQIFRDFECCSFVANVREESERCNGLVHLREKVLSKLLEEEFVHLETPNMLQSVRNKIRRKKFCIVLDDVNNLEQLEFLTEGLDQYSPKSRIIITTRDKQVLRNYGVNSIYEVEAFDEDEALELFCKYAFKHDHPLNDLLILADRIVDYTKGNPLALKVLGSSLYRKSKHEWESLLHKLRKISNPKIHNILRISYDGLDSEEKDIFLDIACFLKGENRDYVIQLLDACYLSAEFGLSVLVDKSLITISRNCKIEMHGLLQEMGQEVVRQESFNKPGERSRLHNHEDVCLVLRRNVGTEAIKGINLDMSKIKDLDINPLVFEKMSNLKFLKFYNQIGCFEDCLTASKVHLPHGLNYLPEELRSLHWHGYPLNTLPSSFNPENLVEVRMPYCNLEQLWEGTKDAPKLKQLFLCHSPHLSRIPEPSYSPWLEQINLNFCPSLVDIPSSIQHLNHLHYLSLKGCKNLRSFPSNIRFRSQLTLDLTDCINLTKFPQISGNVKYIYLSGSAIEEVPSSVESLTELLVLDLSNCTRLKSISASIGKLKSFRWLNLWGCLKFESFQGISEEPKYLETSLTDHLGGLLFLSLNFCKNLEKLPSSISSFGSLRGLYLSDCPKLNKLPDNLGNLTSLKHFSANRTAISQLPSSITGLMKLETLECHGCKGLTLPPFSGLLCSLKTLRLNDCSIVEIPEDIGCLSSLEALDLCGNDFESLPKSIKQLSKLRLLLLNNCNMLQSLAEFPLGLQRLEAMNCKQLQSLPEASEFAELVTECCSNGNSHFMQIDFMFTDCLKLNQKAFSMVEPQLIIQSMATAVLISQEKGCEEEVDVSICLPGSKIPEWFNYQSFGSSVIDVPLSQHNRCNSKFAGFALCAVIAFNSSLDQECCPDVYYNCRFETYDGDKFYSKGYLNFCCLSDKIASDHVLIGYHHCSNVKLLTADCMSASVCFLPNDNLENCGVRPIYAEPSFSFEKFCATNHYPQETSGSKNPQEGQCSNEESEKQRVKEIVTKPGPQPLNSKEPRPTSLGEIEGPIYNSKVDVAPSSKPDGKFKGKQVETWSVKGKEVDNRSPGILYGSGEQHVKPIESEMTSMPMEQCEDTSAPVGGVSATVFEVVADKKEKVGSPGKRSTQQWKRAAREGPLLGKASRPIRKLLIAQNSSKKGVRCSSLSPNKKRLSHRKVIQISPQTLVGVTGDGLDSRGLVDRKRKKRQFKEEDEQVSKNGKNSIITEMEVESGNPTAEPGNQAGQSP